MKLIWYRRRDGQWNAECLCGATLCGSNEEEREEFEVWHFSAADEYKRNGNKYLVCGAKQPTPDPNENNATYNQILDDLCRKDKEMQKAPTRFVGNIEERIGKKLLNNTMQLC